VARAQRAAPRRAEQRSRITPLDRALFERGCAAGSGGGIPPVVLVPRLEPRRVKEWPGAPRRLIAAIPPAHHALAPAEPLLEYDRSAHPFCGGIPSDIRISAGQSRSYFLIARVTGNASSQTPHSLRITHLTNGPASSIVISSSRRAWSSSGCGSPAHAVTRKKCSRTVAWVYA
jgi:hypothetical protein